MEGASVKATVKSNGRAAKISVFKYKAKTRQRTLTGHRRAFTVLTIDEIVAPGVVKKEKTPAKKVTTVKPAAKKATAVKASAKKTTVAKPAGTKTAETKSMAKKTTTAKPTTKKPRVKKEVTEDGS